MLFDTHSHLNADQFQEDTEEVLQRARSAGVKNQVIVGFDNRTITSALALAEKYEGLYAAVGWHPVDAVDFTEVDLKRLEALASHEKVVAIGETGLDYYWDKSPHDVQEEVFRIQIDLAKRVGLPLIIHNRDATADVVRILREENAQEVGGIMHCFTGSVEIAKECIAMNFLIGLGGPVTFKNAKKPKEVAVEIPLDKLLIETDAPYLAPHPFRGKRNEPSYVKLVAEEIARLKGISFEEVAAQTTTNANKIFQIEGK